MQPTCVSGTRVNENQFELEPMMKRRSFFVVAMTCMAFLCVFLSGCGAKNGQGSKPFSKDGANYLGAVKDVKPNGLGTFTYPDGS